MRCHCPSKALLFSFAAACALISAAAIAAAEPAPVSIAFDKSAVVVSGVTPGGKAVIFVVSRELTARRPASVQFVRRTEILLDTARSGSVTYDLGKPVPSAAIWAAVDLTTGRYVVKPSPGYSAIRLDGAGLVKNDSAGQLRKLHWPAAEMEALLVRPGDGAWRLTAAKYSKLDEHGAPDQPIGIDVANMAAVGDPAPAPKNFKRGDVVVLIDPRWMQYAVAEVGQ
jgi:hypothetical protein